MTIPSILVIEDHPVNQEILTDLLECYNFKVLLAATAEAGIALAQSDLPDLILMDLSLPGMSGLKATELLKANPLTASIPIIAVTAHAVEKYHQAAIEAGCSAFITKPFSPRDLILEVKRIMQNRNSYI